MNDKIQMYGNMGCYINDGDVISFQIGNQSLSIDPGFELPSLNLQRIHEDRWLNLQGYQICCRGMNNTLCDEVAMNIKQNRLLPSLIRKQIGMLYGKGPAVYKQSVVNGKLTRVFEDEPIIQSWLESWQDNGCETDYKKFAYANIKNYYFFKDFFVKWRFTKGKSIGMYSVAGLETLENSACRLATTRTDVAYNLVYYSDFRFIALGKWYRGISPSIKIYPKFNLSEVAGYRFAAISHHREKSVDEFYGVNETHQGTKPYIVGSNQTAGYINSFLRNSLAAKIHIVIPNAWVESKRKQITNLCQENKARQKKQETLLKYNGIDIGTEYKESILIQYMQSELRKIGAYLSGEGNQGKAYATTSFNSTSGDEQRWKIETVDLKYKEYIEALIAYDKRADEVLLSSVGLDSSISSVSKDGVISKSGADSYYNYLIYLMSLTPEDEICCEPFNLAIKVNFPDLYNAGYRIGFYRELPERQENVAPDNRLNQQQP